MSAFVLDASYTLTWCFPDRATSNTDAALRRMEALSDNALVPWVWQVEVGNALGKTTTKSKIELPRALEIWDELLLLMNLVLIRAGYPPIAVRPEDRAAYIAALQRSQSGEGSEPFETLLYQRLDAPLEDYLSALQKV